MEWVERLNNAINYIEKHLTKEIDYDEVAKIACCSTYHFQRMFAYMADIPLSEYIRRRRMSRAAVELQNGEKVIDVSLKYGYDSPTAFNRAFKNVHGIAPSKVKETGIILKAIPPISFKIMIKGEAEMNYKIEKKDAFRIIGVSTKLHKEISENFENVPKLWQKSHEDGTVSKLLMLMKNEPKAILGVSSCGVEDDWKYYIAVANKDDSADGLEEYTVPAATWAVFSGKGAMPTAIQELEKKIVTEWFPTSGYEYGNSFNIEVYLNQDPQNSKFEVWIPVEKKKKNNK